MLFDILEYEIILATFLMPASVSHFLGTEIIQIWVNNGSKQKLKQSKKPQNSKAHYHWGFKCYSNYKRIKRTRFELEF